MARNGRTNKDMLESITEIRVRNNDLWMRIMAIALEADPDSTKALIREIAINDSEVTVAMRGIADGADT
jgi:hypothetical protein